MPYRNPPGPEKRQEDRFQAPATSRLLNRLQVPPYSQGQPFASILHRTQEDKSLSFRPITRRELIKIATGATASGLASALLSGCGSGSSTVGNPGPSACAKLSDIEHVVIFIQENRSFDHYFGSYRGVRGFSDQSMAFQQPDPAN